MSTPTHGDPPCGNLSFRGALVEGVRVHVPLLHRMTRYGSLMSCGARRALLFSVIHHGERAEVRALSASHRFSAPVVAFGPQRNGFMSPNVAATCLEDGQTLVALGGMREEFANDTTATKASGVWRSSTVLDDEALPSEERWSRAELVVDGDRSRCFEHRVPSACAPKNFYGHCEFDGRLSLVLFRGTLMLFARANLDRCGGARHVQVAKSVDGGFNWSPFMLLRIKQLTIAQPNNIYFFHVQASAMLDRLVALYPAALNGGVDGGTYVSFSDDGLHWTAPERLIQSAIQEDWRTGDHPMGFIEPMSSSFTSRTVSIFVQHDIQLLRDKSTPTFICEYAGLDLGARRGQ